MGKNKKHAESRVPALRLSDSNDAVRQPDETPEVRGWLGTLTAEGREQLDARKAALAETLRVKEEQRAARRRQDESWERRAVPVC